MPIVATHPNRKLRTVFQAFKVAFPCFEPRGTFLLKCVNSAFLGGLCFDPSGYAGNENYRYVHVFCNHLFNPGHDCLSLSFGDRISLGQNQLHRVLGAEADEVINELIFEIKPYLELMDSETGCYELIRLAPDRFRGAVGLRMNCYWFEALIVGALWLGQEVEAMRYHDEMLRLKSPLGWRDFEVATFRRCAERMRVLGEEGIDSVRAYLNMERRLRITELGIDGLCSRS